VLGVSEIVFRNQGLAQTKDTPLTSKPFGRVDALWRAAITGPVATLVSEQFETVSQRLPVMSFHVSSALRQVGGLSTTGGGLNTITGPRLL